MRGLCGHGRAGHPRCRAGRRQSWAGLWRPLLHGSLIGLLALGEAGLAASARAAESPAAPEAEGEGFSAAELDEIVGPIALYPDELLALVLPASTYPLQIVQAARLLEKRKSDPDLEPDEDWDPSVIGLMNYPEVVELMNGDLDWTWKLGEAVASQQEELLNAVQRFRGTVDEAGNLDSNDKVTVSKESEEGQQIIVIESASPEVIYVPTYQPTTVVVQQPAPYPYYYSPPYPYYYSPAAAFWTGVFVGSAVGWGMSWGWRSSSININRNVNIDVDRPTRPDTPNRPGNRPGERPGSRPEAWKADRGPGKQAGARPGGQRPQTAAKRPAGSRPQGGAQRPGASTRPSPGREGASARPSQTRESRQRDTRQRSPSRSSGRDLTTSRASRGSSLGNYSHGSRARSYGSRGASSRGRMARGGGGRRR